VATPDSELVSYVGVGLNEARLTRAIVLKSRSSPGFLGRERLMEIANLEDRYLAEPAARALLVMQEKPREFVEVMKANWKDTKPHLAQWLEECLRHCDEDRRFLEYGITWGPVGERAAEAAIADLEDLSTWDDRWIVCVEAIRKARKAVGIKALLRFAGCHAPNEPSDQPFDQAAIRFPAATALVELGEDVPRWVEMALLGFHQDDSFPCGDRVLATILVAIMGYPKTTAWLDAIGKMLAVAVEDPIRQDTERLLSRLSKLRQACCELSEIPTYSPNQQCRGPLARAGGRSSSVQPK
jgi:hypothetical protein